MTVHINLCYNKFTATKITREVYESLPSFYHIRTRLSTKTLHRRKKLSGNCKCPPKPLHKNCHCYAINISSIKTMAGCHIEKFTKYIFADGNSKKQLFKLWGYDIIDSEYLQQEFIKQAELAYSVGDYTLGLLNEYGQRINIIVTLKRKNQNTIVTFRSGWMVYPNGKIILITPYGAK